MTPSCHIHYFGLLADRRGLADETIPLRVGSVAELYAELEQRFPQLPPPTHLRAAVNDEFVPWSQPIGSGDRIAFMPPMSGG